MAPTVRARADNAPPQSCADCHDGESARAFPGPPDETLAAPVHESLACADGHESIKIEDLDLGAAQPHGQARHLVECGPCHEEEAEVYERHGHLEVGADPESTIYHFNIPDTCGHCHEAVTADYWEGIQGQLVKRGAVDSPVCTHCHGEHGIIDPADPKSLVSAARLAEETCTPCHESD